VKIAYPIEDHIIALSKRGKDYKMYLKETVLETPVCQRGQQRVPVNPTWTDGHLIKEPVYVVRIKHLMADLINPTTVLKVKTSAKRCVKRICLWFEIAPPKESLQAKIQSELTDACHVKNIDLMKSQDAARTIPVLDANSTKTVLQRWISVRPIAQPLRQQPRN